MEQIPEWALERAREIADSEVNGRYPHAYNNPAVVAFARYIAEHEPAPIDPDVRLVADIINTFEGDLWMSEDVAMQVGHKHYLDRAVAKYKELKNGN